MPSPLARPAPTRPAPTRPTPTRPTLAGTHEAFLVAFGNRGTLLWSTHLSHAAVNPARTDDAALRSLLAALCASADAGVARFGGTVSADVARYQRGAASRSTAEAGLAA